MSHQCHQVAADQGTEKGEDREPCWVEPQLVPVGEEFDQLFCGSRPITPEQHLVTERVEGKASLFAVRQKVGEGWAHPPASLDRDPGDGAFGAQLEAHGLIHGWDGVENHGGLDGGPVARHQLRPFEHERGGWQHSTAKPVDRSGLEGSLTLCTSYTASSSGQRQSMA